MNEAYLRQELHKLRNKQKSKSGGENTAQGDSKGDAGENKGGAKDKGGDKKGDKGGDKKTGKGGNVDSKESEPPSQWVETATGLRAMQSELEQIKHQYTYLNLKRSAKPENAIYAVDVVIADSEVGPTNLIKQGWNCIYIPIEQYTGIHATYHTSPWLCFKRSKNLLREENEKKSL